MFRRRDSHKPPEDFYMDFKANYSCMQQSPVTTTTTSSSATTFAPMDQPREHLEWSDYLLSEESPQHDSTQTFNNLAAHFGLHGQQTPINDNNDPTAFFSNTPSIVPRVSASMQTPPDLSSIPMSLGYQPNSGHMPAFDDFGGNPGGYRSLSADDFDPHGFHSVNYMSSGPEFHNFQSPGSAMMVEPRRMHTGFDGSPNGFQMAHFEGMMAPQASYESSERFRFRVTLENAGTAMTRGSSDPVTYLNKSQKYKISIKDTQLEPGVSARYRTVIGITFEAPQLRQNSASSWQLWKNGRGASEAYLRESKLRAVEFVDPTESPNDDEGSDVTLSETGMRTVTVNWGPNACGKAEATIMVRFNCLSTDFSLSKGVAGTPLRLFAETEVRQQHGASPSTAPFAENCYCKVKIFRDHGAERKHQNDNATVKKQIDKLMNQMEQAKTGGKESGKRRRSDSVTGRPAKAQKTSRSLSVSSEGYSRTDDKFKTQILNFEAMKQSRKAQTLFHLRGDVGEDLEQDDDTTPRAHSAGVQSFEGPSVSPVQRRSTFNTTASEDESPTPSSQSFQSPKRRDASRAYPTPSLQSIPSNDSATRPVKSEPVPSNLQNLASPPDGPTRVSTLQTGSSYDPPEIDVLGVDDSYVKPEERQSKAVACFYVRPTVSKRDPKDQFYRAIYLYERTLSEFVRRLAAKSDVDPDRVKKIYRISNKGLDIEMDDEIIYELPEGQDMLADFERTTFDHTQAQEVGNSNAHDNDRSPLELKLRF